MRGYTKLEIRVYKYDKITEIFAALKDNEEDEERGKEK